MAFMNGWDFVFAHEQVNNEVLLSASILKELPLISIDRLFREKSLTIDNTYFVVKEGVYCFLNSTWMKK